MNQPNETTELLIGTVAITLITLGVVALMIYGHRKNLVIDERDKRYYKKDNEKS